MSQSAIVIVSAARTAVGSFHGGLSAMAAHELGACVIRAALERAGVDPDDVNEVIMGHVLAAGEGQNPARQAAMKAGLGHGVTAFGINQLCGSGLRSVALGMQQILTGDAQIVVAGGMETMSLAPHCTHLRNGPKIGDISLIDTMLKDGLTDAFYGYPMGMTAENVARQWNISRQVQDEFAVQSHAKAHAAQTEGRFAEEIVPFIVPTKGGDTVFDTDEHVRANATLEGLAKLRTVFDRDGSVTAGNASGINDGAAALVLMSEAESVRRGITPLARIVSWATAGVDPQIMGTGPVPASRKALAKAGWRVSDLDLIEANEAFAAQSCVVQSELGLDPTRLNVNGGAIALGHPIGASGARVLTTLLYAMKHREAAKGLATLCIGGGMGIAMCVERV